MTLPCDLFHVRPASSPCVPLTCRAEASVLFVSLAPSHARAMRVTTVPRGLHHPPQVARQVAEQRDLLERFESTFTSENARRHSPRSSTFIDGVKGFWDRMTSP